MADSADKCQSTPLVRADSPSEIPSSERGIKVFASPSRHTRPRNDNRHRSGIAFQAQRLMHTCCPVPRGSLTDHGILFLREYRYTGVIIALVVAVGIWLLSQWQVSGYPNWLLYDWAVSHRAGQSQRPPRVLLVDVQRANHEIGEAQWLQLIEQLEQLGAHRILFDLTPRNADAAFYRRSARDGRIHVLHHLSADPEAPDTLLPRPLPAAAADYPQVFYPVQLPQAHFGVYRDQHTRLKLPQGPRPSFAVFAADIAAPPDGDAFLINFRNPEAQLPVVGMQRVLAGDLIPRLVQDMTVIVGTSADPTRPTLYTPMSGDDSGMPLLQFRGQAIDTLLTDSRIVVLDDWVQLSVLLLICFLSLFIYQWLRPGARLWISLTLTAAYAMTGWLLLSYLRVWIPVFEMSLVQLLIYGLMARYRASEEDQALQQMLFDTSAKLQERVIPASFYRSTDPWTQVITLVNQTLDLSRLIFLERVPGDHRVREIKALNCSLDDIHEMRRDYERTPYSTAIEQNGPIRINRAYLREIEDDEDQYLVPLIFASDVLGFWAFGVDPQKVRLNPGFMGMVRDYSVQIAELLYHRQRWQLSQREDGYLRRFLMLKAGGDAAYEELARSLELMERRLGTMEGVFDGLSSATILYDLFGRVVQMNQVMERMVQANNLPAYEMTALDLLTAITRTDASQGRQLLQHVINEQRPVVLPAVLEGTSDKQFVLHVRALSHDAIGRQAVNDPAPFQMLGILFELMDVTDLKNLCRLRDTLIERLNFKLRNDLSSVVLASDMLRITDSQDPDYAQILDIVQTKVSEAVQVMTEAQQHLDNELDLEPMEHFPVDPKLALNEAMEELSDEADKRRICFAADTSPLVSLVMAEPGALKSVMLAILELLLEDAAQETIIRVELEETPNEVHFHCSNNGFGMPDETFHEYLHGDSELSSGAFRKLRNALRLIEKWDGRLEADSEVGSGIKIHLTLRGFI